MMKKIKLFGSMLAVGMLLSTGISVTAIDSQVQAATQTLAAGKNEIRNNNGQRTITSTKSTVPQSDFVLTVNEDNAEFDENTGTLSGFSEEWVNDNVDKIVQLLNGGQLKIPDTLHGVSVTTIGERGHIGQWGWWSGAFSRYVLQSMIGEDPNDEANIKLGISSIISGNKLTNIEVEAFDSNNLVEIDLPNVTTIDDFAFYDNQLIKINLSSTVNIGDGAFENQNIAPTVMASKDGEVTFDQFKPQLILGNDDKIPAINGLTIETETDIKVEDGKLTGALDENPIELALTLDLGDIPENTGDYSIGSAKLTINPFKEETPPIGGGGAGGGGTGSSVDNDVTDNNTDTNTSNPDNNDTVTILPTPDTSHPYSVYAIRSMRLHKNVSLTNPVKSYKKQSRSKAAKFKIQSVAYDKNGNKRYKVNGGYITANSKYVADSHFRSSKIKQVRVIGNRVNSYKNVRLSKNQQVRSYKKGTKLQVRRIVKHGRTTRFQLTNGRYVTGNKQLLIMDHK